MLRLLLYLTAVLHFSTCGAMEMCQGQNQCSLCTVTGPTVIDTKGQVNSVQDRCAYTLMKTSHIPDIEVHAIFQERRRTDVSFLDSIILQLDNPKVNIYLEQGGRVKVGKEMMTFSDEAQTVHGVTFSRDEAGVTAKISHSSYTMTVFFDGYTAQIHIEGPRGDASPVEGLCGDSNGFSQEKSDFSLKDCDVKQEDDSDSTINCKQMTLRCNLLKDEPFTACHSHADPEPYITACKDTLCKYPAVDGLKCQFLEAYARACSLYSTDILQGWRSKAVCSDKPQALCQDKFCSAHEFCGEDSFNDGFRCHCRAIFASTYRSQNTFGEPVSCSQSSRSVSLVDCLLGDKGIRYSDLHLYDKTCRGEIDDVTHMVTIGFDSKTKPCGTTLRLQNGRIINKNGVIVETTKEELLDLTCPFVMPTMAIDFSVNVKVIDGPSRAKIQYVTSGEWKYVLTMKAYTNPDRTHPVDPNTKLHLNQKVWFELKTDGVDDKLLVLVTQSCYATNEPEADGNLKYYLITNGCANPVDESVVVESNGQGTSNHFSFKMFQFVGKSKEVYLHCNLKLCLKEGNTCAPNCSPGGRRRRSVMSKYADEKPNSLIMAWTT